MNRLLISLLISAFVMLTGCTNRTDTSMSSNTPTAEEILADPVTYPAMSYSGYRGLTLEDQPTLEELKEDMRLVHAMGFRIVRTYKLMYDAVPNLLKAIRELKQEDEDFEMYVMMGAWIDAKNAWTDEPERIRDVDSPQNKEEIERAIRYANEYPDIVKIIAVGNEAMVHWQTEYWVEPSIILNWVRYLQEKKQSGELNPDVWITSSDNFASWGGGSSEYHKEDLDELIREVDYISMHTYPMHDTHYNPVFWGVPPRQSGLSDMEKIDSAMVRATEYAISQYNSVVEYMRSVGEDKPVHIGETGWATVSNEFYGAAEAKATDEYKMARYFEMIHDWANREGVAVFYFEAFDEQWKDAANPLGSENHFGLINLQSEAKYALWDMVDEGVFDGLTRDGKPITKTFGGDRDAMMKTVLVPPTEAEIQKRLNQ